MRPLRAEMSIFTSSRLKTENFWSAVTRAWTIYKSISVLNWKQTESTPSADSFSTGFAISRNPAPESNWRDWLLRSGAPAGNESRNCSWKRQPASKINRTLTPPPHERLFHHHRLLGYLVSFQRDRSRTDVHRSGPVASSREIESADGGPPRSIVENTGASAGHGFANHKFGRHPRVASDDAISYFQIC